MALNKLKKFVTEEVMDEVSEDEYYDVDKTIAGNGKMILFDWEIGTLANCLKRSQF